MRRRYTLQEKYERACLLLAAVQLPPSGGQSLKLSTAIKGFGLAKDVRAALAGRVQEDRS